MTWRSVGKDNADLVQQLEGKCFLAATKICIVVLGHEPCRRRLAQRRERQLMVISDFFYRR